MPSNIEPPQSKALLRLLWQHRFTHQPWSWTFHGARPCDVRIWYLGQSPVVRNISKPWECLLHFRGWKTIHLYSYTQKPLYESLSTNQYVMVHVTYGFSSLLNWETQSWPVDSHAWMAAEMETYHPVCWWILRFTFCGCKVVHWGRNFKVFNNMIHMSTNLHLDYSSKSPTRNLFQNGFSFDETLLFVFKLNLNQNLEIFWRCRWACRCGHGPISSSSSRIWHLWLARFGFGMFFFLSKSSNVMNLSKKIPSWTLGPQTRKTSLEIPNYIVVFLRSNWGSVLGVCLEFA